MLLLLLLLLLLLTIIISKIFKYATKQLKLTDTTEHNLRDELTNTEFLEGLELETLKSRWKIVNN